MQDNVSNMIQTLTLPLTFESRGEMRALVAAAERDFEERLSDMASRVSQDCVERDIHILRLSGPTCAGKTTAAKKLTEALEAKGLSVYPISLDDFYYDRDFLQEKSCVAQGGELDYDSAETLNLERLHHCVQSLLTEGRASLPVYDFTVGRATEHRLLEVPAGVRPIFLFEGIQAVYPQVVSMFSEQLSRGVFIQAQRGITVGMTHIPPHRLRLMRRLVRDAVKRDSSPSFTLSLWKNVRANEEVSILPFAPTCEDMIDSTMAYEVHVLAPHLRRLLEAFPVTGPDAPVAESLLQCIAGVEGIPSAFLPAKSLYREFIPVSLD